MTDLKRLADKIEKHSYTADEATYMAVLLRSAAAETVGTVWANHPDGKLMCNAFADATHNRDLSACRLALAAARKERDEAVAECERHRNDAFREADACRTITAERAALQRAIDEAIIFVEGHLTDENRRKLLAATLRPHATPSQPERQWSSTPPSDRSGKWWNAFGFECSDQCLHLVPNTMTWDQAENGDDWGYDLWLPYVEGDTRDSLPPLPNSSATVTSSPAPRTRTRKGGAVSKSITFDFAPGEPVTIPAIEENATVIQACVHMNGSQDYQVIYWHNAEWRTVWLPASQLRQTEINT